MDAPRRRAQAAIRAVLLLFVVAWLFSERLRVWIPFWLPFAVLLLTEAEFLFRGLRESRRAAPAASSDEVLDRRRPGADDADLGWLDEELGIPAPRRERERHPRRLLAYLGGAVGVIALFVLAQRSEEQARWSGLSAERRAEAQELFSSEASRIARRAVRVDCDESYTFTGVATDAAGVAFISRGLALLAPDVCRTLHDLAYDGKVRSREDAAWALTVLAHEAVHLRGVRDEALTECFAVQEGVALGRRLGLDEADARALMRAQLERSSAPRDLSRLEYRPPPECRDGGELDLRPADPEFP
jgi:hypothetical protein